MADIALENAKTKRHQLLTRRDSLKAELNSLDRDLADTEDFILNWYRFAGVEPVENLNIAGTPVHTESPLRGTRKNLTNPKKEDVAAEVRKIIEAAGAPVLRKDLMPVLQDRHFKIEGSDPDMVLSTMLWRAGAGAGVVRLKKGGYWLKERPWPDTGYDPDRQLEQADILGEPVGTGTELKRQISQDDMFTGKPAANVFD